MRFENLRSLIDDGKAEFLQVEQISVAAQTRRCAHDYARLRHRLPYACYVSARLQFVFHQKRAIFLGARQFCADAHKVDVVLDQLAANLVNRSVGE